MLFSVKKTEYCTFFTWLAVVVAGMEVESMLVVFLLLFKLFMISLFLAFSKNSTNIKEKNLFKL